MLKPTENQQDQGKTRHGKQAPPARSSETQTRKAQHQHRVILDSKGKLTDRATLAIRQTQEKKDPRFKRERIKGRLNNQPTKISYVGTFAGHTGHRAYLEASGASDTKTYMLPRVRSVWWKGYHPRVRPHGGSPKDLVYNGMRSRASNNPPSGL